MGYLGIVMKMQPPKKTGNYKLRSVGSGNRVTTDHRCHKRGITKEGSILRAVGVLWGTFLLVYWMLADWGIVKVEPPRDTGLEKMVMNY